MTLRIRIQRLEGHERKNGSGTIPRAMPLAVFRRWMDNTISENEFDFWRPLIDEMLGGQEADIKDESDGHGGS